MNQGLKLTDIDQQIIDIVVSRFVAEKKPTPRRQLLVKFEDPDILETLINRSFLQDVGRHSVLPTLLAFQFSRDVEASQLARESVNTVLYVLRTLFLETEENRQITPAEIETKARELGRTVGPKTIWLGLYLVQNFFGVLGTTAGNDQTPISWLQVSEGILKYKSADNAWETRIEQELQWVNQRNTHVPARPFPLLDDDIYPEEPQHKGLLIFISHSSKDGDIALSLIELLKAALGLTDEQIRCTSVDGFRLPSGANVDDVLKAEVLEAQAFIGLITPNSLASAYVLFELGARWGARRHMIPVLAGLDPGALQGPLKGINSISAAKIGQLHQLMADLADELSLNLQRAAGYTRYAEKLVNEVQHIL